MSTPSRADVISKSIQVSDPGGFMYFSKEVVRGYNCYIDRAKDDMGTMMDVGLLVMEKGDVYAHSLSQG